MSEVPKTKVKGSVEVDIVSGKIGASTEVTGIPAIVNSLRSPDSKIRHAMADRISQILKDRYDLSTLTPAERLLLLDALHEPLKRAANRADIRERALAIDPSIAGLLASPGEQQSTEISDDDQYFWDRFWPDAEVVTVPFVKQMYAHILAGKLKDRGAFSLRTLDALRCMDTTTGKAFALVAPYVIETSFVPTIFTTEEGDVFSYTIFSLLTEAGLLVSTESSVDPGIDLSFGSWFFRTRGDSPSMPARGFWLTLVGRQLLRLVDSVPITRDHGVLACHALSSFGRGPCLVATNKDGPWVPWLDFFAEEVRVEDEKKKAKEPADPKT